MSAGAEPFEYAVGPMGARFFTIRSFRYVIAIALTCVASVSGSACLPLADSRLAEFDRLMLAQPAKAEREIETLLQTPAANEPNFRATLYASLAAAYSVQEKHDETHTAVKAGLALVSDPHTAVYLNLLYLQAISPAAEPEIMRGRQRAEALMKVFPDGSPEQGCVLLTLGLLEHFADRPDQASIYLTRAYRMSKDAGREQQRVIAATVLSMVMQRLRDLPAALTLVREAINSHARRHAEFELAMAHFMEGFVLTELRDHTGALASLERSRALSTKLNDPIGIAYSDHLICTNQIRLGRAREARALCERAQRGFEAANIHDAENQVALALAEIDLVERNPNAALEKLNRVLANDGNDMPPFRVADAFELRSRVHRELSHFQAALLDFEQYVQRFKANKEDERAREATAIRARFETDREIERNDFLRRELQSKNDRLSAQSSRLHWMIAAAVAGLIGVLLLTLLLVANRRKRHLLARLATEDDLTGLANRRYTLRRAEDAFESVRRNGGPLTIGILDLDHFKRINDQFGHAAGDFVLREFARIARENVRDSDLLGRWGGEEFLIVMPNTPLDVALLAVDRIRRAAGTLRGGPLPEDYKVTVSVGLAHDDGRTKGLHDLIAEADGALYQAKKQGRDRVHVAQASFDASATSVRRNLRSAGIELETGKFAPAR